jgi:carbamoyl-phosphate synthase large subunit
VFVSVSDRDKRAIILPVLRLQELGYEIAATEGTAEVLRRNGIEARQVLKFSDKPSADAASVVELINRGEVDVVVNTPSGRSARADGYEIRAAAVAADIPLFTTIAELSAAVASLGAVSGGFEVTSLQEYGVRRAASIASAAAIA